MSIELCPSFGNQNIDDGQCDACMENSETKRLFKDCCKSTLAKSREVPSEDPDLPKRYDMELGRMHVVKGRDHTGMKQMMSWETVKPCRGERCPAYDLCEYWVKNRPGLKCKVEKTYLRAVTSSIYRNYISVLDEPILLRIGLHLMPIYQNLCRLKIAEVGITDILDEDSKGKSFINPLYKEMREHIKLLEQTWRSLGLSEYFIETEMPEAAKHAPDADIVLGDSDGETVAVKKKRPVKRSAS